MVSRRDRLLRNLAVAMATQPGAGLQQLGEAAGVSRATLYRLSPTREQLIELLRQECIAATKRALESVQIDHIPPREALLALTRQFVDDAELYAFGFTEAPPLRTDRPSGWAFYEARMLALFDRGKAAGDFRSDLSSDWLLLAYDTLVQAALLGLLRGTIARASAPNLAMNIFCEGIHG